MNKIRWSIEQRGLTGTIAAASKSIARRLRPAKTPAHPFDERHSVDTSGYIAGHGLGAGHSNDRFITGYAPIPASSFCAAIEKWRSTAPPPDTAQYTFVDVGCGKGRALLLASQLGFREVVGVELNPRLADIATANIATWTAAGKARCPIRIVCGDALEFDWPAGPTLVYLYNPFGEPVVRALSNKLSSSYANNPDELELIYQKSEHSSAFEEHFNLLWSEALPISPEDRQADLASDPRDESRGYRLRKP